MEQLDSHWTDFHKILYLSILMSPPPPPPQIMPFMGQCEKYCRAGQAIDDNIVHAHCMLDTYVYRYILRIYNIAFPLQQWLQKRASLLCYSTFPMFFFSSKIVLCMR